MRSLTLKPRIILVLQSHMLWKIPVKIVPIVDAQLLFDSHLYQLMCFCKNGKNRISTIAITKIYKLRFELINYPVFIRSDPQRLFPIS